MAKINKISLQEKQWRAEADAETMRRYQEIIGDKLRRALAIQKATSMAEDYSRRAAAMKKAAGGSLKSKRK